jgi:hypothetical protein
MEFLDLIKNYTVPFERHVYHSSLSGKEIQVTLSDVVEPKKFIRISKGIFASTNTKPYEGCVREYDFKIQRITHNSYAPLIKGEVSTSLDNKTTVKITIRLKYYRTLFLLIFILILLGMNRDLLFEYTFFQSAYYSLLLLSIGFIIAVVFFKYESAKSRRYLKRLLSLVEPTE